MTAADGEARAGGLLVDDATVRAFLTAEYGQDGAATTIEFFTGGVSSAIIRVSLAEDCFVLKQSLPTLRVAEPWHSRPERSLIEVRCARALEDLVPGSAPRVQREFPERHAFAMDCAPQGSQPWKATLLAGVIRTGDARRAGALLGDIHACSAARPELAGQFADRSFFDELRLDPYLRHTAERHPELKSALDELIEGVSGPGACLVHADFSPKNLLVTPDDRMLIIDHEVAHWGSPAFDVAFLVNHLCLKALRFSEHASGYLEAAETTLGAYRERAGQQLAWLAAGSFAARLLGGLMLARIDGKSPVEYITTDDDRVRVREVARRILGSEFRRIEEALGIVRAAT